MIGTALLPLQLSGIKILPYLDDWLICAPSRDQVLRDTGLVLSHIQSLGLKVNWMKSNLEPIQQAVFVGLHLDSVAMSVSLTSQRVGNILALLSNFRLGKWLDLVKFQRLLGMILAAVAVVPLGLLRAQPLQRWFNALGLHPKLHRRAKFRVTRDTCFAPMEGHEAPYLGCSPWEYSFEKDGGDHGCLPDRVHQRLGTEGRFPGVEGCPSFHPSIPFHTKGQFFHGVLCELPGGHQVTTLPPGGTDTSVLGGSTSSITQGSLHPRCCEPGGGPPVQDGPSPRIVKASPRGGGPPVGSVWHGLRRPVRLCRDNTLQDLVLPNGRGGSLGLDALSHKWPEGLLYAFPPLQLIPQVLHRVTVGRYKVLLIAPQWPRKHWFPRLLGLPGRVDLL